MNGCMNGWTRACALHTLMIRLAWTWYGPATLAPSLPMLGKVAKVGVRGTLTGYFVPGRVDMGSGLLGIFVVVVSCRVVVAVSPR